MSSFNILPREILCTIFKEIHETKDLMVLSHAVPQLEEIILDDISRRRSREITEILRKINPSSLEALMEIYTPPVFPTLHGGTGQTSGGIIINATDFFPHLSDDTLFDMVKSYLNRLADLDQKFEVVTKQVTTYLKIPHDLAKMAVIQLCSAHIRYEHDSSEYINYITDTYPAEDCIKDSYVQKLPKDIIEAMIEVYHALCVRWPSYRQQTQQDMMQNVALYRFIIRVSTHLIQVLRQNR